MSTAIVAVRRTQCCRTSGYVIPSLKGPNQATTDAAAMVRSVDSRARCVLRQLGAFPLDVARCLWTRVGLRWSADDAERAGWRPSMHSNRSRRHRAASLCVRSGFSAAGPVVASSVPSAGVSTMRLRLVCVELSTQEGPRLPRELLARAIANLAGSLSLLCAAAAAPHHPMSADHAAACALGRCSMHNLASRVC